MLRPYTLLGCLLAVGFGALGCTAAPDEELTAIADDELRALTSAEIIGDLSYGQTSQAVAYTKTPLYRAFRFEGRKGDQVEAWVRSSNGDARAWLLRANFATLATNLDAAPGVKDSRVEKELPETGTYYVVFRETAKKNATFTVSLAKAGGACDLPMVQTPKWEVTTAAPSGPVVLDTTRGRLVAFTSEGTSEFAAGGWTAPSGDPFPVRDLSAVAIAFDADRGKAILFGGRSAVDPRAQLGDTWEWDSATSTWTEIVAPGIKPRARFGHAVAYDAARKRVVLFGGYADSDPMTDTWTWDGASWSRVGTSATAHPAARSGHGMAFDAQRGRVVLYGQSGPFIVGSVPGPNTAPTDTWEWDGAGWTKAGNGGNGSVTSDGPYRLPAVYDTQRKQVVRLDVTGGRYQQTFVVKAWNGSSWSTINGSAVGPKVDGASATSYGAAYDAGRSRLLLTSTGYPWKAAEFSFFEEPNRAPVLGAVAAQRVFAGDSLRVQLAASDPDGHPVRYRVTPLPAGASLDEVSGVFSWQPTVADVGTHNLTVEATDGCAAQNKTLAIVVDHLGYPNLPAGEVDLVGKMPLSVDVRRTSNGSSTWAWPELGCTVTGQNPGKVVVSCTAKATTGMPALPAISASVESNLTFAYRENPSNPGVGRILTGKLEPLVDGTYKLHVEGFAQLDANETVRAVNRAVTSGIVDVAP